ncbi:hypothetical protein H8784_06285 [Parabacteroides acidifaciens]|uniref:Uncharacterized protein n=1 Tax=Parabacteroides acidifaciens TaxID=2290935 RepID=A0A3D8HGE5_9BACT|nr:hypothetical protein [Parabacteroides acidifaciens]MBC8601328.1 hypothetical protein [Parabacteroides acidifaciens]RDU50008.1 hypothetical protein DWU89_06435 [Parabacteroides acidifaciens]
MSIRFSAVKKGLFPLSRESIAGKSTFISFIRNFIALKTVVIPYEDGRHSNEDGRDGDEDGRHGDKAPEFPLNIWDAARLRFATGDSPGVKLYHIGGVSSFRQSNCTLSGTSRAPHLLCCQSNRLKP